MRRTQQATSLHTSMRYTGMGWKAGRTATKAGHAGVSENIDGRCTPDYLRVRALSSKKAGLRIFRQGHRLPSRRVRWRYTQSVCRFSAAPSGGVDCHSYRRVCLYAVGREAALLSIGGSAYFLGVTWDPVLPRSLLDHERGSTRHKNTVVHRRFSYAHNSAGAQQSARCSAASAACVRRPGLTQPQITS